MSRFFEILFWHRGRLVIINGVFFNYLYIYIVNGCPLAILEGFIPFTNFLSTDLKGSSSWPTPPLFPPRDTSERRVLAGKAATIGREVGVNSALEPEPGGGEASFLGKILSGRNLK